MKTEESLYIKILVWAYKRQETGFLWGDLVKNFELSLLQDEWAQKIFRSNMPITENLVDYLSHDSRNQGRYVITAKGIAAAIQYLHLKEAESSGKRAERIAFFAIVIGVVTGVIQIIMQVFYK
jgi:hypothetical protein